VTRLLASVADGDERAVDELLPLVYEQLHGLAERHLRGERPGHTLQPTALVHEVYLKLVGSPGARWRNRAHFVAIATRAMRQVLVTHALRRRTAKRGGRRNAVALDDAVALFEERSTDLLALDEALTKLAQIDAQQSRIVELRFFGGLTVAETAEVTGVPTRTVEREWTVARAWLRREIEKT
jgi:RNA polymerase sigma factor (TIGR02999 family)